MRSNSSLNQFKGVLIRTYTRPSQGVILNDLEWLNKIFNDKKHRVVSLQQPSFLFSASVCNNCKCAINSSNELSCALYANTERMHSKVSTSSSKLRYTVSICIIQYHSQYITINWQPKYSLQIFFSISLQQKTKQYEPYSSLMTTVSTINTLCSKNSPSLHNTSTGWANANCTLCFLLFNKNWQMLCVE